MSFLIPFMQERDTYSNLKDVGDDDNEDEPNEDEYDDENDDRRDDRNNDRGDDRNNDREDVRKELHAENEKKKKQKEINRKIINLARNKRNTYRYQTQPETASVVVMKYLLDNNNDKPQITPPTQQSSTFTVDTVTVDTFFSSKLLVLATVKSFSPYYQNIAKSQIFSIISDLEMKQIMQEQPFFVPNTFTQRQRSAQMPAYHPGPYNVSRSVPLPSSLPSLSSSTIQILSSSPLRIATSIPSPSYYEFPATVPTPQFSEETAYIKNTKM